VSKQAPQEEKKKVKLIRFVRDQGAYGLIEYEMSEEMLAKYCKEVNSSLPDIFGIFINNLTKKAREIFEI